MLKCCFLGWLDIDHHLLRGNLPLNETILLSLCAVVALIWGVLTLIVWWSFGRITTLHPDSPSDRLRPSISVIVPARNEIEMLEHSLRSLLAQTGVDLEVIVINDHSTDGTGDLADSIAAEDNRVRVIHDPDLPEGWLGKLNGMHKGATLAKNDLLLFTDADIIHAPGVLALAVDQLESANLALLSLLPLLEWKTFWENMIVPSMFLAVPMFAHPRVQDPDSDDAVGAGAFLLVRRQPYESIGGHEPLKAEVVDDMMLARTLKRNGHHVDFQLAPDLLRCRMFRSNREAFWGLTKNALHSVEGKPWAPVLIAPGLGLLMGTGLVCFIAGVVLGSPTVAIAGAALYFFQWSSFLIIRRMHKFNLAHLLGYPLGIVSLGCCILRGMYEQFFHGAVMWRGRRVKLD